MGNFQDRENSTEYSLLAPWGLDWLLPGNRALLRKKTAESWTLAQMDCRAAKQRLLEGQRNKAAAAASAKKSSGGTWMIQEVRKHIGTGLHGEALRKFTMEHGAGRSPEAGLPPASSL